MKKTLNKIFTTVKIFHCFLLEVLLTKYLRILFNYNLITICCQFLIVFINRTRVLVGIVMFKAR